MRAFMLVLATVTLSACQPPVSPSSSDSIGENPPDVQVVATSESTIPSVLPAGLQPVFAYKVRSTNQEHVDGKIVRRAVIEYLGVDVNKVDNSLEVALANKGYRRYKTISRGQEIVGDYARPEHRITVTVSPADGRLALSEGASGTVYFVWND